MDPFRLPPTFSPPEAWPEYGFIAEPLAKYAREIVSDGIRYAKWPYCFEEHVGDIEPSLTEPGRLRRNRKILWKRTTRTDTPDGWYVQQNRPWRSDGYINLKDDYRTHWNRNAKRSLEIWEASGLYVEEISFDEFVDAYNQSFTLQKAGPYFIDILRRKWELSYHPTLWGIRDPHSKKVIAGTAVHFLKGDISVWECPFVSSEGKKVRASTGLMEYWFKTSLQRGVKVLLTVYMGQDDDPPDWQRLVQFKKSFGFNTHTYPPTLTRFVWGKFF